MDVPSAEIIEFVRYNPRKIQVSDYVVIGEAEQSHQSMFTSLLSSTRAQVWKYVYDIERLQDNFIFLPAFAIFLYFALSCLKSAHTFISPNTTGGT